jgi:hypothetical protein
VVVYSRFAISTLWSFGFGSAAWVFVIGLSHPSLRLAAVAATVPLLSAALRTRRIRREAARMEAATAEAQTPESGSIST